MESLFNKLKENEAADKEAFSASQKKFEALNVGMEVNDEGKTETLQEQLMSASILFYFIGHKLIVASSVLRCKG